MPLETSRVQTPYRGVRGIRVRPAPGSQTFTGHELVARMLPVLERTGWEMHASVFIQGLGWRSVARWVSAQELSHGPLGVFYNMNTYEMADYGGDADEDPINLIEDATIYLRPPQRLLPEGAADRVRRPVAAALARRFPAHRHQVPLQRRPLHEAVPGPAHERQGAAGAHA
eukprot:m.283697 g.283697  ORF g.283697 m.283697 type:complete len:171 (+) comp11120_c0_seq2:1918-2430(+)